MQNSPFSGLGSGKRQLSGKSTIDSIPENTGPKPSMHKSTSNRSGSGKTEGPSGDVGHLDWNPRAGG